jgi:MarR family transcriptional regulator for hemolysin
MTDRTRNFGFLIKGIGRLYTKLFEHHAQGSNWTLAECKVLTYVHRHAGISQIGLAELADIEPMSLVRILDRMEAQGLVERRRDPADRRARQLFLCDKAQATLEQLWTLSDHTRAQALAGIKAEERQLLIDLLERIHQNLSASQLQVREAATAEPQPHAATRHKRAAGRRPHGAVARRSN